MIILRVSGGLGNQMFQYAFGLATARRLKAEVLLDLSDPTLIIHQGFELERVFGIRNLVATESDLREILGLLRPAVVRRILKRAGMSHLFKDRWIDEPHFHFSPEMNHITDNVYINGHWQSEKYFANISAAIREVFSFKQNLSEKNASLAFRIVGTTTAISMHVRRGDYVSKSSVSQIHPTCSMDYYALAINQLASRVASPYFYVFSDDVEWVQSNLQIPYPHELINHNRGESSFEDMRLMSLCSHHIIANSSFSWWGAWLNPDPNKIVVAPRNWFKQQVITNDLYPQDWIVI